MPLDLLSEFVVRCDIALVCGGGRQGRESRWCREAEEIYTLPSQWHIAVGADSNLCIVVDESEDAGSGEDAMATEDIDGTMIAVEKDMYD